MNLINNLINFFLIRFLKMVQVVKCSPSIFQSLGANSNSPANIFKVCRCLEGNILVKVKI